jgi:2-amino-4-hydroxy-6-hydroxymethyldihydropteridine diphosphokinase
MKEGKVFIGIGGNLENTPEAVFQGLKLISKEIGTIINASRWYRSFALTPEGINTTAPIFFNAAIEVETSIGPEEVLNTLLHIEKRLGRERKEKWSSRLIDLDLLFFRDRIINTAVLTLPHPELSNRDFVLKPLSDIAPEFVHPVIKRTITDLLSVVSTNTLL